MASTNGISRSAPSVCRFLQQNRRKAAIRRSRDVCGVPEPVDDCVARSLNAGNVEDGHRLVGDRRGWRTDRAYDGGVLYTVSVDGGTPQALIKEGAPTIKGSDADPSYSPDGRYVAFRRRVHTSPGKPDQRPTSTG